MAPFANPQPVRTDLPIAQKPRKAPATSYRAGERRRLLWGVTIVVSVGVVLLMLTSGAQGPTVGGGIQAPASHVRQGPIHGSLPGLLALSAQLHAGYSAKCGVKTNPQFAAYDPVNHYVYVSSLSNYVAVINDSITSGACHVKTNIALPAGAAPEGVAYAPIDGQIYVADNRLNQVYVINGTKVVGTITNTTCQLSVFNCAFTEPYAIAYDPDDGHLVVTNAGADNVTVIGPLSFQGADYSITTGGSVPDGVAYSPGGDAMVVTNWGSNDVSWFAAQYSQTNPVGTIPVGTEPVGVAADPFLAITGYCYVANYGSNNVTTIAPNGVLGFAPSIAVGQGPVSIVFDQANLRMYVTNHFTHDVSVIGGDPGSVLKTINLPSATYPFGAVYDEEHADVYVIGLGTSSVYVVS
ncbi:MAG: YncE family protein [Thermoplasmata archaeon]|nr:YncE family protein [Thermoplasmata archaeon]